MKIIKCKSIDKLILYAYNHTQRTGEKFTKCTSSKNSFAKFFRIKTGKIVFSCSHDKYHYGKKDLFMQLHRKNISVIDFINHQLMMFL